MGENIENSTEAKTHTSSGDEWQPSERNTASSKNEKKDNTASSKDEKATLESIKTELAKIRKEGTTTKTQVEIITGKSQTTYILLGAVGVVALVAFIFALLAFKKASKKTRTVPSTATSKASGGSQEDIRYLQREVAALREELELLRSAAHPQRDFGSVEQRPAADLQVDTPPTWKEFVEAYNALARQKLSFEVREERKNFGERFGVRAFSCVNYEQRMRQPNIPLEFADTNIANGEYWAMPYPGGRYAVVPCMKAYEEYNHFQGGMKESFESNYEIGKTYNVITVLAPAIFEEGWKLVHRGKLKLSN